MKPNIIFPMSLITTILFATSIQRTTSAFLHNTRRSVEVGNSRLVLSKKYWMSGTARNTNEESSSSKLNGSSEIGAHFTSKEKDIVDSMLYRIRECNHMPEGMRSGLLNFVVDGKTLGKLPLDIAKRLCDASPESKPVFEISSSSNKEVLILSERVGHTCQARSDAVMEVMTKLRQDGMITGWRDELLPLAERFYDEPILLVERAAAPFLGMQQYGVHINGLVQSVKPDGQQDVTMWMARRSATKSKYPGMLDHIVAGGQPAGLGLMENVIKECMEEAGISESITKAGIKATGGISYETIEHIPEADSEKSNCVISRSMLFCYDLYLPEDFEPKVIDGEVDNFFVWSLDEVMDSMKPDFHDPIKPNCYPCIIDFLLRDGHISPEVPGYLDILRELRGGYCG